MREKNGDAMHKLKKAVAVAVMVGGIGLVGGGVAHADNGHNYNNGRGNGDPFPFDVVIGNLQSVQCEQPFDAGLGFAPITTGTGDVSQNVGNTCTVIGSVEAD